MHRRAHIDGRRAVLAALALATALLAQGCSPMPEFDELTIEETYQIGEGALEDGDHLVATQAFLRISNDSPMHELADDALLGLGDAYRQISDYASAEDVYLELIIDYPQSPLVPEAQYKVGLSYYEQSPPAQLDQRMTMRAIDQLRSFADSYPDSPFVQDALDKIVDLRSRLARKDYENGMLYLSLESPEAARVYFEAVADEYPDTVWGRRALLELARAFRAEGSVARAEAAYERLMEEHPGTEEAATASTEAAALGG